MIKHVVFFILLGFLSVGVFASELKAEFNIDGNIKQLKEGDLFKGTLRVWPIESVNKDEFLKLSGKKLFNAFYLIKIESIEPSPNNADVIEIKAEFAATGTARPDDYLISYNGEKIKVSFEDIAFKKIESNNKKFEIMDQEDERSYKLYFLIFVIAALLIAIVYFKKSILKLFKKEAIVDPKEKFRLLFKSANEREDFEAIYLQKEVWIKYLLELTPAHREFFATLNKYQYKKTWSVSEKNEVVESFEVIRRSFE